MNNDALQAYKYALNLLARQDYSRAKIQEKLRQKKYDDVTIASTIETLIQKQYLNEQTYRNIRIKNLIIKNYSVRYIEQKIASEKLRASPDEILALFTELHTSEDTQLLNIINKKKNLLQGESQEKKSKNQNKLYNYILSKGHSLTKAKKIIEQYKSDV